ncbi:molybdenum cofactor guanylyltransferase MobA [Oxalobacteraceae bacterium R-40]|uniref:Molybdenum cofactor guanylyltransferase n=1 Tax=Keguizhuia sedimenti TaxID=3064264 RepID=A0ABU1BR80_9BURK|nr:molybdenum cofactor guanylyltransferase MobA [Oxalobacteraceae bacterium R-40]
MELNDVTGLILAGGRGSRMGSVDKGLQTFRGKPMVKHAIERLSPQVGSVMINANQNLDVYKGFGVPVYPDEIQGFAGPLAGLQTGLLHCRSPFLVTVPCDSPFFPLDFVSEMGTALLSENGDLAVAVTGQGEQEQPHPVFCLVRASLLPHLSDFLQSGQRKIDKWYATLKVVPVRFADENAFSNINTLDELTKWEERLAGSQ